MRIDRFQMERTQCLMNWGGELAGARGRGREGSLRCSRMALAVEERRTTATRPPGASTARTVEDVGAEGPAEQLGRPEAPRECRPGRRCAFVVRRTTS
jgi:hypothetical protein